MPAVHCRQEQGIPVKNAHEVTLIKAGVCRGRTVVAIAKTKKEIIACKLRLLVPTVSMASSTDKKDRLKVENEHRDVRLGARNARASVVLGRHNWVWRVYSIVRAFRARSSTTRTKPLAWNFSKRTS